MKISPISNNGNFFRFADGSNYGPTRQQVTTWALDHFDCSRVFASCADGMNQQWYVQRCD